MTRRALVLLALFVAAPAAAETKSFAAVKNRIPAGTNVVLGVDFKAVRASTAFPKLLELVYKEDKDVKQMADTVKSACGIDAITAITDVTVIASFNDNKGTTVIGFDGVDETKAVACVGKAFSAMNGATAKITTKRGKVSEYGVDGTNDKLYAAWLAKDVVALGFQAEGRTQLDALLAGKPATGDLATFLGKASGLVWGAIALGKDGIRGGYGGIALAKGVATLTGRIVTIDDTSASATLADMQRQLASSIKHADKAARGVVKLLEAVRIKRAGTDVTFEASAPEAELPALLPALDKVL